MTLNFNLMENDVFRPIILKAQMDSRKEGLKEGRQDGIQIGEKKGRQDGIQIGEKKGRKEEAACMLLKLIRRKFSQTPTWVAEKVKAANLEQIEVWGENVLFANSVEGVFAS